MPGFVKAHPFDCFWWWCFWCDFHIFIVNVDLPIYQRSHKAHNGGMMASTQAKNNTPCVQCRFSRHNITQRVISAALIVRLGRGRRGHSRFLRGLQRAVCSLRGWKTRLLASIFFKSGNRTRGRGRMKNRPKNRKLPDFRISGKNLNSGKTA